MSLTNLSIKKSAEDLQAEQGVNLLIKTLEEEERARKELKREDMLKNGPLRP